MQPYTIIQKNSNLCLYNQLGLLKTDTLFQPLGVQPLVGSYLLIGSNEWLNKNMSNVTITLYWADNSLPENFTDYYKGYSELSGFTNSSFKVNCYGLNQGNWDLLHAEPLCLFQVDKLTGALLPMSRFHLQVNKNLFKAVIVEPLRYTNQTQTGFFKIELIAPDSGFGGNLYSDAINETVLRNAKEVLDGNAQNQSELPLIPYTPIAKAIEVQVTLS